MTSFVLINFFRGNKSIKLNHLILIHRINLTQMRNSHGYIPLNIPIGDYKNVEYLKINQNIWKHLIILILHVNMT